MVRVWYQLPPTMPFPFKARAIEIPDEIFEQGAMERRRYILKFHFGEQFDEKDPIQSEYINR